MSNHYVQKIASVILVLGIFVSIFMAAQTALADSSLTLSNSTTVQQ